MGKMIIENCGIFSVPQLLLSIVVCGILLAYLLAFWRREVRRGANPWEKTLVPLSSAAVTLGLLGTLVGCITAFGGFHNGLDVQRLTQGLSTAYWTTAVGIVTSLAASLGSYTLTLLNRKEKRPCVQAR